ncbi:hypothetical protein, partial [Klebsiella quasipneumoniae]|uniref:hypothetical protein n=1 Tax=Klebsiella quasipneumoniae TaxID=1463165 RepID=UPI0027320F96
MRCGAAGLLNNPPDQFTASSLAPAPMPRFDSPRLLADIGGTFARFTLETGPGEFTQMASLRCADHV